MGPEHRRGVRIPLQCPSPRRRRGLPLGTAPQLAPEPAGGLGCWSPGSERRAGGRRCRDRWSESRGLLRSLLLTAQPLRVLRPIPPPACGHSGPRCQHLPFELPSLSLRGITTPCRRPSSARFRLLEVFRLLPAQARGWKPSGAPPGTSAAVGHPRKRARGARASLPIFKGASSLFLPVDLSQDRIRLPDQLLEIRVKLGVLPSGLPRVVLCVREGPRGAQTAFRRRLAGLPQKPLRRNRCRLALLSGRPLGEVVRCPCCAGLWSFCRGGPVH